MVENSKLKEIIKKLRNKDPKISIQLNSNQSAISIIRGKISEPVNVRKLKKSPYEHARQFIHEKKEILGISNEKTELDNERAIIDSRKKTHVTFNQKHGKARVLGSILSIHYDTNGSIYLINSNLDTSIDVPDKPKITATRALEIAKKHAGHGASSLSGFKPELVIGNNKTLHQKEDTEKHFLCWKLEIIPSKDSLDPEWIYFVDAINGKVLLRYSTVQTGTGTGYYSQGTALNSEASGSKYILRDSVTTSSWSETNKPVIHTFDDAGSISSTLSNYSEDNDDIWGDTVPANRVDDQRPEVDVHRFVAHILDYFHNLGRNSWDGNGADVKVHAHNEKYPNNAYWSGTYKQLYFADGDNINIDFMCALDILGHEFTHGVNTGFNIVQTYIDETGALNEAIADIFGIFNALNYPAECPNPMHFGSQIYLTAGHRGRYIPDPSRDFAGVVQYDHTNNATKWNSAASGYFPDHYSIRYTGPHDKPHDYGGVHLNSPIISHAIYLMIFGGTHRYSGVVVTGISQAPVEEMLYEVISTGLLSNSSEFADFRTAFILACQTLYPDNLDYLSTVKAAFHAVGVGPDLYIRDTLTDSGEEPGTLSCMSPDIIVRNEQADAATLALINNVNNSSLGQEIELGPDDNYIYFRLFNRGSVSASGTFRLFISPSSTFPTPTTWHEVGYYVFPDIPPGGVWLPSNANECITLPATLVNALGLGHYCFIGIIESDVDPPPDRMLISDYNEFHEFISKSNNYAWRNCDIKDLIPDTTGAIPVTTHSFIINGLGFLDTRMRKRDLEIDTRNLPEGTEVNILVPKERLLAVKAFENNALSQRLQLMKATDTLKTLPVEQTISHPIPWNRLTTRDLSKLTPFGIKKRQLGTLHLLTIDPGKIIRFSGLSIGKNEKMEIRFAIKFPNNTGTRDVTLAFRELGKKGVLGQMNYVFRIRKIAKLRKAKALTKS